MLNFLLTAAIITLVLALLSYLSGKRADRQGETASALSLLPGDIKYESPGGGVKVYFPITTSIVLSIVLSLVFWLFS
jgi:hypothetical protein